MKFKTFIIQFFAISALFFLSCFAYVSFLDPYRLFELPWQHKCKYHKSDVLKKYELIEQFGSAEAVIIGASTSESYTPTDIKKFFNLKAFNASIAGGDTAARLSLTKKALEKFKPKAVFYIADFFEFNKPRVATKVFYNNKLRKLIPNEFYDGIRPKFTDRIWDAFSYQSVESATDYLKDCIKGTKKDYYLKDGMTTVSMVLSDVNKLEPSDPMYEQKLNKELDRHISLHFQATLIDYNELSPVVAGLSDEIINEVANSGAQLFIVLSPYHPRFLEKLKKEGLYRRREEWANFWLSKKKSKIHILDVDKSNLYPGNSYFWKDGHHPTRKSSFLILKKLSSIYNDDSQ